MSLLSSQLNKFSNITMINYRFDTRQSPSLHHTILEKIKQKSKRKKKQTK